MRALHGDAYFKLLHRSVDLRFDGGSTQQKERVDRWGNVGETLG